MVVPVIDFSKLDGEEREATMAEIHNGCQQWGFFQVRILTLISDNKEVVYDINQKL